MYLHIALTSIKVNYLAHINPYESRQLNLKEIVNEILIALAAYPLWMYTDWANEEKDRIYAGWLMIGAIMLIILFNLGFLTISQSRLLII